jgi:hypothetical protein
MDWLLETEEADQCAARSRSEPQVANIDSSRHVDPPRTHPSHRWSPVPGLGCSHPNIQALTPNIHHLHAAVPLFRRLRRGPDHQPILAHANGLNSAAIDMEVRSQVIDHRFRAPL